MSWGGDTFRLTAQLSYVNDYNDKLMGDSWPIVIIIIFVRFDPEQNAGGRIVDDTVYVLGEKLDKDKVRKVLSKRSR